MNAPLRAPGGRFTSADHHRMARAGAFKDMRGRLILRHADPGPAGFARREPFPFGQPAPWLTGPLSIDTSRLV